MANSGSMKLNPGDGINASYEFFHVIYHVHDYSLVSICVMTSILSLTILHNNSVFLVCLKRDAKIPIDFKERILNWFDFVVKESVQYLLFVCLVILIKWLLFNLLRSIDTLMLETHASIHLCAQVLKYSQILCLVIL